MYFIKKNAVEGDQFPVSGSKPYYRSGITS